MEGGEMRWDPRSVSLLLMTVPSSPLAWMHLASSLLAPNCALTVQRLFVSSCCVSPRADRARLEEKTFPTWVLRTVST